MYKSDFCLTKVNSGDNIEFSLSKLDKIEDCVRQSLFGRQNGFLYLTKFNIVDKIEFYLSQK